VPARIADITGQAGINRRVFLQCCAAVALAAPGCATLGLATRSAYTFLNDPPLEAYRPVLDALMAAVLPCEHTDFPLSARDAAARVLTLFQLETDSRFAAVQRMLLYFNDTDLFTYGLPLVAEELIATDAREHGVEPNALLARKEASDRSLYAAFVAQDPAPVKTFTSLSIERRREYFTLWSRSDFVVRRQFYSSARALGMIAAYSMDDVWPAIGYGGPLLPRTQP
jgi:hypothetical protein